MPTATFIPRFGPVAPSRTPGAGLAPVLVGLLLQLLGPKLAFAQTPADSFPWPDDSTLRGVRLDRPRAGAAAIALQGLARCDEVDDASDPERCILSRFPARDLMVRDLLHETREASIGAGPGIVRYHGEQLGEPGPIRLRRVQRPAMRSCALVLKAALRGRCDDLGPVPGLKPIEARLQAREQGLLSPFLARLPRVGRRRTHRVVCGPFAIASAYRFEEAAVVLGLGKPRAILDLRCRTLLPPESASESRASPGGGADPAGMWREAKAQTEAVRALALGLGCLDTGGGACQPQVAPLTFMQLQVLVSGLGQHTGPARRASVLEALRERVQGPAGSRSRWVMRLAYGECAALHDAATDLTCITGPARSAQPPRLPRGLSAGQAAQARALKAMIEAPTRGLQARESTLRCDDTVVKVVYARREDGTPALLGVDCRLTR